MKKTNGGKREGAGRPRFEKEHQIRRNVMLSDRLVKKARALGAGNLSAGLRKAIDGV